MKLSSLLYAGLVLTLLQPQVLFSQKATVTEEVREIPTYGYDDPNPVPLLTDKKFRIYPYYSFDGYRLTAEKKKWKVVKLENGYIEVYILPELGGKVWGAIEKSTGKEFIYRNDVIKFRNISLRGPWTSGGIEFNFGLIGHTPATAAPVDYTTRQNPDGSVSCIVGSMDLPSRTQWRVEIRLPADKAYFETIPFWNNPTPLIQNYYCFMTGAAAVSDDLEFYYPGNQSLEHNGEAKPWPVDEEGRQISRYAAHHFGSHTSIHTVGEYNDFFGGYYHNAEFGFGHWALYEDMPGRKLWLWALSREGGIWEDLLTDTHGQYMELQAGRSFNQYAQSSFRSPVKEMPFHPGTTDQWREIWFPVKDIGGMQEVSPQGVLNVTHENGKLNIGINALAFTNAKVLVKTGDKILFSKERSFHPMEVFKATVDLPGGNPYEVTVEGMDLKKSSENKDLLKRPFQTLIPDHPGSPSGKYLQGTQFRENRNYKAARQSFRECLAMDPLYIDAMTALTGLYYRSNQYDSALYYANQALQLNAYDPAANYFAGITYRAQGDLVNALETLGWAARSMEFRSVAYAAMAGIELQRNDLLMAEQYARQALDFNRFNINAFEVLAILYRKQGNAEMANQISEALLKIDPLDHFAAFEQFLWHPSELTLSSFQTEIKTELGYQACLELAITYFNLGQREDAEKVLLQAPDQPLVMLWRAFLQKDTSLLGKITPKPVAFVFPYRTETAGALEWAVHNNPNWKFKYLLALNYQAIEREEEAGQLFTACGQEPDEAVFYATRAALAGKNNESAAQNDLLKARQLAPNDWRTSDRLIGYYLEEENGEAALRISNEAQKKFPGNYNIALLHARALLLNHQFSSCVKLLEKTVILPFEGSTEGKKVYEQACLFYALDLFNTGKYRQAAEYIDKSKQWPENLGVGKPYDVDTRLQDYMKSVCLLKMGKKKEAAACEDAIIKYTFSHEKVVRPSFNQILPLIVLREKGETAKA